MRAFRYRLQAVLRRAQHAEQLLQIELARLEDQLTNARRRLDSLRRLRTSLHGRLRNLHQAVEPHRLKPALPNLSSGTAGFSLPMPTLDRESSFDLPRVALLREELEQLDESLARAARLAGELETRVGEARRRLLEAARSRQLFESHRDGLASRHRRAELHADIKRLDDLATLRFAARSAEPGDDTPSGSPRESGQPSPGRPPSP